MKNTVILCTAFGMGRTNNQSLNMKLIVKYFDILLAGGSLPAAICFYTDGVKLTCAGSRAVHGLQLIQGMGVRLLICRTCLDEMGLTGRVRLGIVGGMPDIIDAQIKADKVITI